MELLILLVVLLVQLEELLMEALTLLVMLLVPLEVSKQYFYKNLQSFH